MLSNLELNEIKSWALYLLDKFKENVRINLDITNIECDNYEIPQNYGIYSINQNCSIKKNNNYLQFSKDDNNTDIFIHYFENYNSLYVSLYDKNGKRWFDTCLIIWSRTNPKLTNFGYAPGRCPDYLLV